MARAAGRSIDFQRTLLYRWEDGYVGPRDPTTLTVAQARAMVPAIWVDMGLRYPPRVEALIIRTKARRASLGNATRNLLRFREGAPSWVLLHEIAHCMTMPAVGSDGGEHHGPVYVGVYLRLLERYLRLDRDDALRSMRAAGVQVDPDARPTILDTAPG